MFLQWAYKLTNKKNHEDQMVRTLVEYDAIAMASREIPELARSSFKWAPPAPVKENLEFPGAFMS